MQDWPLLKPKLQAYLERILKDNNRNATVAEAILSGLGYAATSTSLDMFVNRFSDDSFYHLTPDTTQEKRMQQCVKFAVVSEIVTTALNNCL